uniref:G_PROTEIN_RECEP_F1_2 domain-containing protein n=1 Tax=Steinernema glaseri TaxID=37863 RepID=A0A1I7ZHH6_9BILA
MASVIAMDYNLTTTVHMLPSYFNNAITVICSILPSLAPNIFILVVGINSSVIRDKFRNSIVTMTIGNLFAAIVPLGFHLLYFYFYYTGAPINFLLCSFLRRFTTFSYTPMLAGSCLVAVERFYGVCLNKMFSRGKLLLLTASLWFYPFLVFLSQMTSSKVRIEDICGPTKGAHFTWLLDINTGLFIGYPIVAFGLNAAILMYLSRNSKKLVVA